MIQINDKIISSDIFFENFACNLAICHGICCVDGDSGAPLENKEIKIIEEIFDKIKKYLPTKNLQEIQKKGLFEIDSDGDCVTPCINNNECVYLLKENNIHLCAFEKAFRKNEINFIKPISCHLYPIKLTEYKDFTAVNYQKRKICKSGQILGKSKNIKIFEFLEEPLIRKFGNDWYKQLKIAANHIENL